MKATSRIFAGLIGMMMISLATTSMAEGPAPHGYLLSVWSGSGQSQTHAMLSFEGEDAYDRCRAAETAMRAYKSRFNNEYTICIPF